MIVEHTELSEGPGHSFDFSKFENFCIPDKRALSTTGFLNPSVWQRGLKGCF